MDENEKKTENLENETVTEPETELDDKSEAEAEAEPETVVEETPVTEPKTEPESKPETEGRKKSPVATIVIAVLAVALIVCFALLMKAITRDKNEAPAPLPTEAAAQEPASAEPIEPTEPAEAAEPVETVDVEAVLAKAYAAHEPDAVVMTVNGEDVTWSEYFYWMFSEIQQLDYYTSSYLGYSVFDDWNATSIADETLTNAQFIKKYADDASTWYHSVMMGAEATGAKVSAEQEKVIEEQYQSDVTDYGGGDEQTFEEYINAIYLSRELYDFINRYNAIYESAFALEYGEGGSTMTDAEVLEQANEAGYLAAKHILMLTTDEAGAAMTDDAKAEVYKQMEDILSQLRAVESDSAALAAKFDELMTASSQDPGSTQYPDGYCFQPGSMVAEFENATTALGDWGLSDIVETSYGYHIILRLPLDPEMTTMNDNVALRIAIASDLFAETAQEWFDAAVTEPGEGFEALDIAALMAAE